MSSSQTPDAPVFAATTTGGRITDFVDQRVGGSGILREFGRKVFPDHWSFMFGEVALYSFVILLLSGTFLTFFFDPSMAETHYAGSYAPLTNVEMSVAYSSSLNISFDVRGGMFMRQVHHWSALLFVASMSVHMLRVFFTGAFRKPRELNWVVAASCSSCPWAHASPATHSPMTCSPATACASSTASSSPSRSSARTRRSSSLAASSRAL